MQPAKFNDFFRLSNFFYFTLGIKPYDEPNSFIHHRTWLDNTLFYCGMINMNLLLIGEILYVIDALERNERFLEATLTLAYIGFLLVGESKMLSVRSKKQQLTDLVHELYEIFPKTIEEQELYELPRYLRQCKFVTTSFGGLYVFLIWTYNLFTIMSWLIYEYWLEVRVIELDIPYFAYIPWEYHGHWSFYFLYASGDYAAYTCGIGQMTGDLLLCAVATHVIMHYDHVSRSIETYDFQVHKEITNSGEITGKEDEKDLKFLSGMIAYHAKILRLSDVVNDVFGIPLLFNFMIASAVICFVGFLITAGNTTTDMQLKLLLFLFSSIVQIFLICYYGQLLIDVSTNVADAVGHHKWWNADIRYKKLLVLIMQRAQTPSYLKATSLVRISQNTMTSIMQISYKFFALLRTMYAE